MQYVSSLSKMYQHYHTRRSSAPPHAICLVISNIIDPSMHSFSLSNRLLVPALSCAGRCPLYEYKKSKSGQTVPRAEDTVLCTHVVYDYGRPLRRSPRCIRPSTAALAPFRSRPLPADIVQRSLRPILPYASRPSLRAHLVRIALRDKHLPSRLPFIEPRSNLSRRLRSILFFTFIVHSSSSPPSFKHPHPARIVSYRPFSHFPPYSLVNVAASNHIIHCRTLGLKGSPHCSAHSCRLHYHPNRAPKLYYCIYVGVEAPPDAGSIVQGRN
ncbi:hypothetical protein BV20DRAFT_493884 [Pilatotrama ljubarskyi]|nr:hypothetical protein BV20DRAFT_493884 [Pilatotrama ljubarskyi]